MEQLAAALAAAKAHAAKYDEISSESVWERDSINGIVANLEAGIAALGNTGPAQGAEDPQSALLALKVAGASYIFGTLAVDQKLFGGDGEIKAFDAHLNQHLLRQIARASVTGVDLVIDEVTGAAPCPCPNCPSQQPATAADGVTP